MGGFVVVQEWPGLLDVLAVLDGPGQLCVESGVCGAATCSLWETAEKRRDEAQRGAAGWSWHWHCVQMYVLWSRVLRKQSSRMTSSQFPNLAQLSDLMRNS